MNLIWGKKTEKWFAAATKNNCIYIFNPNSYDKESSHKKEHFWQTLKHEYCHIYYTQLTKNYYPFWLNEGLASHLSGKRLVLKEGYKDMLLDIFSYFNKIDSRVYMVGQFWVEFLIKKFGKKKFVELINHVRFISNDRQFADSFYKIYGVKFNKGSFTRFIKEIK
jgi:hypothetical protein